MKILQFNSQYISNIKDIDEIIDIIKLQNNKNKLLIIVFSEFNKNLQDINNAINLASKKDKSYNNIVNILEKYYINIISNFIPIKHQPTIIAIIKLNINKIYLKLQGIYMIEETTKTISYIIIKQIYYINSLLMHNILKHNDVKNEYIDLSNIVNNYNLYNTNYKLTDIIKLKIKELFSKSSCSLFVLNNFLNYDKKNLDIENTISTVTIGNILNIKSVSIYVKSNDIYNTNCNYIHDKNIINNINYSSLDTIINIKGKSKIINSNIISLLYHNKVCTKIFSKKNHKITFISEHGPNNQYLYIGIENNITSIIISVNNKKHLLSLVLYLNEITNKYKLNINFIFSSLKNHNIYVFAKKIECKKLYKLLKEINIDYVNDISIVIDLLLISLVKIGTHDLNTINNICNVNNILIYDFINDLNSNILYIISKHSKSISRNSINSMFSMLLYNNQYNIINIYLVGIGLIGSKLIKLLETKNEFKYKNSLIKIKLLAIANSTKMIFSKNNLLNNWKDIFSKNTHKFNIKFFIDKIKSNMNGNNVFVDCTANKDIIYHYENILNNNISIVTPNKNANSNTYYLYKKLKSISYYNYPKVQFLYETNVGAGLPIISTINNIVKSNDQIIKIEAILSGTISYIINTFNDRITFSQAVLMAQNMGFTEPNPKDDLNGIDVAKKILILAREIGLKMELNDIYLESLISKKCIQTTSLDDFYHELENLNNTFHEKYITAKKNNYKLRYMAVLENNKAFVKLCHVNELHPFYNLSGSDNIISITTKIYNKQPLIIQGPGAGDNVTALGIISDLLKLVY